MTEYFLRFDENDEAQDYPLECDSCGSVAELAEFESHDRSNTKRNEKVLHCRFCASSMQGIWSQSSEGFHQPTKRDVGRVLAEMMNELQKVIEENT